MRKCVLCAAAAACLSAANAETVLFPNADGSGDLSSAAAWNNAMPPMTTDTIVQVLPSGATYTVSTNMTLAPISVSGGSDGGKATFDLSVPEGSDPIVVRMAGTANFAENESGGCIRIVSKRNAEFVGGYWDFGGKQALTHGYQTYGMREIVLSGGCIWTNMTQAKFVYNYSTGKDDNRWRVTEGSQLFVTGGMNVNEYAQSLRAELGAESGGYVRIDGGVTLGRGTENNTAQRIYATGTGSKFIATGKPDLAGSGADNNVIEATDGGFVSLGSTPYITYSDGTSGVSATGNVMRAVGEGSVLTFGAAYFGRNNNTYETSLGDDGKYVAKVTGWVGSSVNVIEARDGGLVSNLLYYVRGIGNGFVVSNGVMATTANGIACQGFPSPNADQTKVNASNVGTNAFLRLQGDHPRFLMYAPTGSSGNFTICNGFRFIYDLPVDGYRDGLVPVWAKRWGTMDATTRLELNGIEAMQARMLERGIRTRTIRLWSFDGGINNNATIVRALVQRWNAELAEKYEGVTLSGDNTLMLTVEVKLGSMLILR